MFFFRIFIVLFFLFFTFEKVDLDRLGKLLSGLSVSFTILCSLTGVVFVLIRSFRYFMMLNYFNIGILYVDSVRSYCLGKAYSIFLPAGAGEFLRCLNHKRDDAEGVIFCVFIEKIIDLFSLTIICLPGLLLILDSESQTGLINPYIIILLSFSLLILFFIFPKMVLRLKLPFSFFKKIFLYIEKYSMLKTSRKIFWLSLGFVNMLWIIAQQWFFLSLFSGKFVTIISFPLLGLATLSTFIPITIGGIGVREYSSIYLLRRIGIGAEEAFFSALALFVVNVLFPAFLGGLLETINSFKLNQEKQT